MSRRFLFPLLATLLLPMSAAAASALFVGIDFAPQPAPHCILPETGDLCPLGYEEGPEPGPGDDTVYVATLIEHIGVDVDPGIPGVQPVRFGFHDDQGIEHPIWRTWEDQLGRINDTLPDAVTDVLSLYNSTNSDRYGWGVRFCPYVLVPLGEPGVCRRVPIDYIPGSNDRDRLYPMPGLSDRDNGTDDLWPRVADTLGLCVYELTLLTPQVCRALNETLHDASDTLQRVLPDVRWDGGVNSADGGFGQTPGLPTEDAGATSEGEAGAADAALSPTHHWPGDTAAPVLTRLPERLPPSDQPFWPSPQHRSVGSVQDHAPHLLKGPIHAPSPTWPAIAAAATLGAIAVALYRRIASAHLPRHPLRMALLRKVEEHPGITIGEAATALDVDYKTMQHHAEKLLHGGHLSAHRLGRMRKLFPNHGAYSPRDRAAVVALQRPGARRLWQELERIGPLPRGELERRSGLSRTAAFEGLRALKAEGLVEVRGAGREALVVPCERALPLRETAASPAERLGPPPPSPSLQRPSAYSSAHASSSSTKASTSSSSS